MINKMSSWVVAISILTIIPIFNFYQKNKEITPHNYQGLVNYLTDKNDGLDNFIAAYMVDKKITSSEYANIIRFVLARDGSFVLAKHGEEFPFSKNNLMTILKPKLADIWDEDNS